MAPQSAARFGLLRTGLLTKQKRRGRRPGLEPASSHGSPVPTAAEPRLRPRRKPTLRGPWLQPGHRQPLRGSCRNKTPSPGAGVKHQPSRMQSPHVRAKTRRRLPHPATLHFYPIGEKERFARILLGPTAGRENRGTWVRDAAHLVEILAPTTSLRSGPPAFKGSLQACASMLGAALAASTPLLVGGGSGLRGGLMPGSSLRSPFDFGYTSLTNREAPGATNTERFRQDRQSFRDTTPAARSSIRPGAWPRKALRGSGCSGPDC